MLGTFDTESVQILRGPQGVLQGVGAAGGAVTFTTPLPSDTFQAKASVTAGNFDTIGATSTIEGPLSDKVLGKIAVYEQRTAGYYNNTTDEGIYKAGDVGNPSGLEPQHPTGLVGGTQVVVVKPTFLINMSDTLKLKIFAQFESDNDGGSATENINPNPAPGAPVKFITNFGYTPTGQPYQTNLATPGWTHITEEHLIGELDWNVGPGVWTTNAAVRNVNYNSVFNNAGSPSMPSWSIPRKRTARPASSRAGAARYGKAEFPRRRVRVRGQPARHGGRRDQPRRARQEAGESRSELTLEHGKPADSVQSEDQQRGRVHQRGLQHTEQSHAFRGIRYQYERKIFDIQPGADWEPPQSPALWFIALSEH